MRTSKHKVCHITTVHPAKDTRIFQKECVSLANHGFDTHLIVANQKSEVDQNVHIHNVEVNTKNRIQRFRKTAEAAYQKALEIDAALYHFHDPELIPVGKKLKAKGKHVIFDSHEDVPLQIYNKPYIPKFARPIISKTYAWYEKSGVEKFDAIIIAGPGYEERMRKMNPNTICIYNFPIIKNSEIEKWENKKDEIAYVGTLLQERGVKEMVQSMSEVNATFNLAGKWHFDDYKKEVMSLSSWEKVKFWGFVNRQQINEIHNRSKIGLATLMPIPTYLDAYPVKMFEYMAAGIPCVISNFPMLKKVMDEEQCGICVDPENPNEIAAAVNDLLQNEAKAKQMGLNGRQAIEKKYNWKTQEKLLLNLYYKILH